MVNQERPTIGIRIIEAGQALLAPDFLNLANNFMRLLSEVDIALSTSMDWTADWSIRELSRSSPAVFNLEPLVREGQIDNRQAIIDTVMEGISDLNQKDIRPKYFSDQALASARDIVSVLGERIHQVEVFTESRKVVCTEIIAQNVREILSPGREMIGAIEGILEAVNSHRGFKFAIYEPVLASRIDCELDTSLEPKALAQLRELIWGLHDKKVRITGILRTNRKGEVRSAKATDVIELRTEPRFKSADEISGIFDITGGLDAVEYVRRMRDA